MKGHIVCNQLEGLLREFREPGMVRADNGSWSKRVCRFLCIVTADSLGPHSLKTETREYNVGKFSLLPVTEDTQCGQFCVIQEISSDWRKLPNMGRLVFLCKLPEVKRLGIPLLKIPVPNSTLEDVFNS